MRLDKEFAYISDTTSWKVEDKCGDFNDRRKLIVDLEIAMA